MIFSKKWCQNFWEALKSLIFDPFLTHLANFRKNKNFLKKSGFFTLETVILHLHVQYLKKLMSGFWENVSLSYVQTRFYEEYN